MGCTPSKLPVKTQNTLHHAIIEGNAKEAKRILHHSPIEDINIPDKDLNSPLHLAVLYGHTDIAQSLISDPRCDINSHNKYGNSPLHPAVLYGHKDIAKSLISDPRYDQINVHNRDGDSPLHLACKKGHLEITKLLHSDPRCDQINVHNNEGSSPLHLSCLNGHLKISKLLLSDPRCDQINDKDNDGRSTLHLACKEGHLEIAKLLIDDSRCKQINDKNNDGCSPLHLACKEGHLEIAKLLIDESRCKQINNKNNDGCSPLHLACKEGHLEIGKLLLDDPRCDQINDKDNYGDSPLHLACWDGHLEIAKLLLDDPRCDQINDKNNCGDSPLHLACEEGHLEIAKLLLDDPRCDQINDKDNYMYEYSPLHLVCIEGHLDIAKLLLGDPRCDQINVHNNEGSSPLHLSCWEGHIEISKLLLSDPRCQINNKNNDGESPLHLACKEGHLEIAKLLLDDPRCKQINYKNNVGDSPIHLACKKGHLEITKLFLSDPRCDINTKDQDGESPLNICLLRDYTEIAQLLISDTRCDINTQDKVGESPLNICLLRDHIEIAQLLISDTRCDINSQDQNGESPLNICLLRDHTEIAQLLISDTRCDINTQDLNGESPLNICLLRDHTEIAQLLISDPKCDINTSNNEGNYAQHIAALNGNNNILDLLMQDKRCNINVQNDSGNTVLHYVCKRGWFDLVDKLLGASQCNKSIKNNRGETFLNSFVERLTTCEHGEIKEVVDRLEASMKEGIVTQGYSSSALMLFLRKVNDAHEFPVSATAKKRLAELQIYYQVKSQTGIVAYAVNRNSLYLCEYLIENGADVNEPLPSGETALHCAVRLNSIRKVQLVMQHKADLDAKWRGLTPFQFAISISSSKQILEILADGKSVVQIKEDLKEFCVVGETPLTCSIRLGVQQWIEDFRQIEGMKTNDGTGLSGNDLIGRSSPNGKSQNKKQKKMIKWYLQKSGSSVKLTPGEMHKYDNKVVIQTVKSCRTNFTQHKSEVNKIISLTKRVLENASEEIANKPESAHLAFTLELAGSMAEGTKCYYPDELDWLCVFKHTGKLEFQHTLADFFRIKVKSDSPWINQCTDGLLEQGKVSASLYSEIEAALARIIEKGIKFDSLHLFKFSFLLRDKISGLQLLFRGEGLKDMVVYVDLVPVFRLPGSYPFKPIEPLPLGVECKEFYLISKKSRHEDDITDYEFHVTTSVGERAVIKAVPDDVRDGFIFAKAVRLASICGITRWFERDFGYLEPYVENYVSEPVRTEDYLTSFILKNVLFAILLTPNRDDKPQSPYQWALEIYTILQRYLKGSAIPAWNCRTSGYLLNCRECTFDTTSSQCEDYEACCKKRWLMKKFTDNIISWMKKNKSELKHVTFR